ncbi:MAG: hypothetical protein Q9178_006958 [Gyalolechia marmorata]
MHRPTTTKRKRDRDDTKILYPAPLVLPGDELAIDPRYPPQSVRAWQREKDRNTVTPQRNVIYIAVVDEDAETVSSWTHPNLPRQQRQPSRNSTSTLSSSPPAIEDIISYLSAFYHPLPVKSCPIPLTFTHWEDTPDTRKARPGSRRQGKHKAMPSVAIRTDASKTKIRARSRSPDDLFPFQLDLNDLIDVAIDILPSNAYALLLLVSHDLYEDDEDIFACGRAYGGSRAAVISTARYNPALDDKQSVDRIHAWPASHCIDYISKTPCENESKDPNCKTLLPKSHPLHLALSCHLDQIPSLSLVWLIRAALTSAHELGHCFGLDHCVYYACCMQGSASLAEDIRQPPYLCPVCEEKVLLATGADKQGRMRRLVDVAGKWGWGGLEGWCRRILEVEERGNSEGGREG